MVTEVPTPDTRNIVKQNSVTAVTEEAGGTHFNWESRVGACSTLWMSHTT